MNEQQVSYLIKAAATLPLTNNDTSKTLLRSYYLMRCRELSKDHGLPERYFSSKVRCSRCLLEWKKDTQTRVKPIKLSTKQRQRIKRYKITNKNKEYVVNRQKLLTSNELEQICGFCKNSIITPVLKPTKPKIKENQTDERVNITKEKTPINTKKLDNKNNNKQVKKTEINVYSKTKDIFSLANENNTIKGVVKDQKVIKNNKKKKDRFAGLCQQAVLSSAKLKQEKEKQNKLNLFLKPSS